MKSVAFITLFTLLELVSFTYGFIIEYRVANLVLETSREAIILMLSTFNLQHRDTVKDAAWLVSNPFFNAFNLYCSFVVEDELRQAQLVALLPDYRDSLLNFWKIIHYPQLLEATLAYDLVEKKSPFVVAPSSALMTQNYVHFDKVQVIETLVTALKKSRLASTHIDRWHSGFLQSLNNMHLIETFIRQMGLSLQYYSIIFSWLSCSLFLKDDATLDWVLVLKYLMGMPSQEIIISCILPHCDHDQTSFVLAITSSQQSLRIYPYTPYLRPRDIFPLSQLEADTIEFEMIASQPGEMVANARRGVLDMDVSLADGNLVTFYSASRSAFRNKLASDPLYANTQIFWDDRRTALYNLRSGIVLHNFEFHAYDESPFDRGIDFMTTGQGFAIEDIGNAIELYYHNESTGEFTLSYTQPGFIMGAIHAFAGITRQILGNIPFQGNANRALSRLGSTIRSVLLTAYALDLKIDCRVLQNNFKLLLDWLGVRTRAALTPFFIAVDMKETLKIERAALLRIIHQEDAPLPPSILYPNH